MKRIFVSLLFVLSLSACGSTEQTETQVNQQNEVTEEVMSQHDMEVTNTDANAFIDYRAAINAALQALASNSSGTTEPTTKYAYQFWADTTAGMLKIRNAANTAWINFMPLGTSLAATITQLNYLSTLTSNAQTQLDSKAPLNNPTFTGSVTLPTDEFGAGLSADSTGLIFSTTLPIYSGNNVLSFYRQGSYTPVVKFGSTAVTTYAATPTVYYVVIGNMMTLVSGDIEVSVKGAGTGDCNISLPAGFTYMGGGRGNLKASGTNGITTENLGISSGGGLLVPNKTNNGTTVSMTHADFNSSFSLRLALTTIVTN